MNNKSQFQCLATINGALRLESRFPYVLIQSEMSIFLKLENGSNADPA